LHRDQSIHCSKQLTLFPYTTLYRSRASTETSTSGTSLTPSVCALASTPSTVMRQTRTESGRGLRVSRTRAMVKTSFIFEENGASSMTQSVTVPDPHGSEKTARENAEHG